LSIDSPSGVLSGTPTAAGDFSFTISATDADAVQVTKAYTMAIDGSLPAATATEMPTVTPTPPATALDTATATASPIATATATVKACAGDCDGDGRVAISELVGGVNIALGNAPVGSCPALNPNRDGSVSIDELVAAVDAAQTGC
jgi:hypothetical protein